MHQLKTTKEWEELVRLCQGLGVSRKSFCEQKGLRYSTFNYWYRKITKKENPADNTITCVELTLPAPGVRIAPTVLDARIQSDEIRIPVAGGSAWVRINGNIRLGRLAEILAACTGEEYVHH